MTLHRDAFVTADSAPGASLRSEPGASLGGPGGVWTLDGAALAVADSDGPATVLVPSEGVRLLAVDLPIANRAKRLAALPFAVEDLIAEPVDTVHLAIGQELAPRRYLVAVVRHDRMAEWIARVEDGGLDHAALVPDCLALPAPTAGAWAVDLGATRAVVRSGDGTGFACPAPLLRTVWEAAGRPRTIAYGAALPADMSDGADVLALDPLGRRLLAPALDLRQGAYARRRRSLPSFGKRLAKIVAIGAAAHASIAAADTLALRGIAERREAETRALVARLSPATTLSDGDIAGPVTDLLPQSGAGGGANAFLPLASRVSAALAPLGPEVSAQAMRLDGGVLTMELQSTDPALAGRVRAALQSANIAANVGAVAGGVRVVVAGQ
ncbi:general secretion pathway protein L [Sphingomonas guangdongensis]|uniref:General secretion pathway protein L n=1 Tax=Sphingomonas guangdongensis TaxID=1141890 RepID=A0A285QXC9_9SPHN|nr:type II secretion system protein GspL [Sphingomonas guangdongensis]SOB86573.1 general secretion pathway protein L [Sphingomonas guangdongensis]